MDKLAAELAHIYFVHRKMTMAAAEAKAWDFINRVLAEGTA